MLRLLLGERHGVAEPCLPDAADAVIDGLRAHVLGGRLPFEPEGAALRAALDTGGDQVVGDTLSPCLRGDVEVVHDPDPAAGGRGPAPEDCREPDRVPAAVA